MEKIEAGDAPIARRIASRRRHAAIALAVLATLAVSGCGSDDEPAAASTEATTSAQAPKGEPIRLLAVSSENTQYSPHPEWWTGAKAAAKAINDAGGVGGRPVEITTCNTEDTPTGTARCGRQAVKEKVAAVVPFSLFNDSLLTIVEPAGIASVGSGQVAGDLENPVSFPLISGVVTNYATQAAAIKGRNLRRVTILAASDVAAAQFTADNAERQARAVGLEISGRIGYSSKTTDYAPVWQRVSDTDPEVVMVIAAGGQLAQISKAAAQDADVVLALSAPTINPRDIPLIGPKAEGAVVNFVVPPSTATELPGIERYLQEMKAVGADDEEIRSQYATVPWLAVHALAQVAEGIDGPVDADAMLKAIKQTRDKDIFGLVRWSPADKGPASSPQLAVGEGFIGTIEDGEFKLTQTEPVDVYALLGKQ